MTSGGSPGALVLVATPIGNLADISPRALAALAEADVIGCEDTRRTRQLLTASGIRGKRLLSVHEHNELDRADEIVALIASGARVALVTDAGMPAISDPGERLVAAVAAAGLAIEAIPGPSAVVMALALSGLPTARFTFEGFLPRKGRERRERLATVADSPVTTVIYEAANRVRATLTDLAAACADDRSVVLARELTKVHEEVWRGSLSGALTHVATKEPRGEFVIVVSGTAPNPPEIDDDGIVAALDQQREGGLSNRDAAAVVAAALGVPKRRVYDLAVNRRPSEAAEKS